MRHQIFKEMCFQIQDTHVDIHEVSNSDPWCSQLLEIRKAHYSASFCLLFLFWLFVKCRQTINRSRHQDNDLSVNSCRPCSHSQHQHFHIPRGIRNTSHILTSRQDFTFTKWSWEITIWSEHFCVYEIQCSLGLTVRMDYISTQLQTGIQQRDVWGQKKGEKSTSFLLPNAPSSIVLSC